MKTMDAQNTAPSSPPSGAKPESTGGLVIATASQPEEQKSELTAEQKRTIIILGALLLLGLVLFVIFIVYLLQPETDTAQIRDVFIIVMALESLLTGFVLIILMIQLARLINLLQNEIKPILNSTNETISHLRGTTVFLSDNLVGPVIKLSEYMAGFTEFLRTVGLFRRSSKQKSTKGE
jgi:hypothetical protein